ncbi:MAG: cation:proton antiporter [Anaerolineales bacterium]
MEQLRFFVDLGLLFLAALIGGLAAHQLRQPLIVGYLVSGILIGPFTPGPSLSDPEGFRTFAEIGVVLLMFAIGVEFSPRDLFRAGKAAAYGAPLGILLTILLTIPVGLLLGWPLGQGLLVGAIISVASTMVLFKFLLERGELHSAHGRVIVGITLAQDLAVVALTILIPALSQGEAADRLLLLGRSILLAAAILVPLLWLSRRAVPALLERVARERDMELFLLVAMAIAVGTAALTARLGLSLALGAFLGGLVLSESDYAHETLARVLPVRDIFVAMFFVSIGSLIRPSSLLSEWPAVLALVLLVVLGKFLVSAGVVRLLRYPWPTAIMAGLALTQIGEFSYVLAGVGLAHRLLSAPLYDAILATSAVTILLNAFLFRRTPQWIARAVRAAAPPFAPAEGAPEAGQVLICGFGRVGQAVADALERFGIPYTAVDMDPRAVREARARDAHAIFGDASNERMLHHVGAASARMAVVALPAADAARRCLVTLRRLRPDLPILVRAQAPHDRERLLEAGATEVIQPETEAGLTMIRHSLDHLGVDHAEGRHYLDEVRRYWSGTGAQTSPERSRGDPQ